MGRKRIKLTPEQKKWHKHLEWYLEKKVNWIGDQDLKDVVLDGKYAVLMLCSIPEMNGCYDRIVCADTVEGAESVMEYNTSPVVRLVELDFLMELKEIREMSKPNFKNYVEMLDDIDEKKFP